MLKLCVCLVSSLVLSLPSFAGASGLEKPAPRDDSAAEKLGFTLGTQAWTWRDRTAFEAIEMAQALGLKRIELFPGQKLSKETGEVKVGPELTSEQRALLKKKLAECAVIPNSFGVVGIPNDESKARVNFEFVKDMGMQTLTCEPEKDAWDLTSKLADEYKVNIAIHNHGIRSLYGNPAVVKAILKDRDPRLGVCMDAGWITDAGFDAAKIYREYEGRVFDIHLKDKKVEHTQNGTVSMDTHIGEGHTNYKGLLKALQETGYKGMLAIETDSQQFASKPDEFVDKAKAFISGDKH